MKPGNDVYFRTDDEFLNRACFNQADHTAGAQDFVGGSPGFLAAFRVNQRYRAGMYFLQSDDIFR